MGFMDFSLIQSVSSVIKGPHSHTLTSIHRGAGAGSARSFRERRVSQLEGDARRGPCFPHRAASHFGFLLCLFLLFPLLSAAAGGEAEGRGQRSGADGQGLAGWCAQGAAALSSRGAAAHHAAGPAVVDPPHGGPAAEPLTCSRPVFLAVW